MGKILIAIIAILSVILIYLLVERAAILKYYEGDIVESRLTYDVSEKDNEIIHTMYIDYGRLDKVVTRYIIQNDLVTNVVYEKHYKDEASAKESFKKERMHNINVEGNIISGYFKIPANLTKSIVMERFKQI